MQKLDQRIIWVVCWHCHAYCWSPGGRHGYTEWADAWKDENAHRIHSGLTRCFVSVVEMNLHVLCSTVQLSVLNLFLFAFVVWYFAPLHFRWIYIYIYSTFYSTVFHSCGYFSDVSKFQVVPPKNISIIDNLMKSYILIYSTSHRGTFYCRMSTLISDT